MGIIRDFPSVSKKAGGAGHTLLAALCSSLHEEETT